jgi:L-fucose isomerase-like protein
MESSRSKFLRRSERDPRKSALERPEVIFLLQKILEDHDDTVVLKVKDHIASDAVNSLVIEEIFTALLENSVCQALYVQNLTTAMNDEQLFSLISLLKEKPIWCLNIGENYNISTTGWVTFCNSLPQTSITHLYVSEHIISLDLKNKMRDLIRLNRKKHNRHSDIKNIKIIERCTHMWW